ncbi:MAG: hypothetical protein KF861_05610 [Planctomycetaceae bacterium]|nr:hypothetical protein [Planctomycetaceae bacterium]
MKFALRTVAGILAGLILVLVLVMAVELFSAVVHPFPSDFRGTTEEVCRHVERYPSWVLGAIVPMWAAAAFVSVWTAHRIGDRPSAALVVLFVLAGLACNLVMLPYPVWFKLANLFAVPAAALLGIRRPRPIAPTG